MPIPVVGGLSVRVPRPDGRRHVRGGMCSQNYYFKTFETGSGSEGYNTTFANPQGQILRLPGWTAADYGY